MGANIGTVPAINVNSSVDHSQRRLAKDTGHRSKLLPQFQCNDYTLQKDYANENFWTDDATCESIACQASFAVTVYKLGAGGTKDTVRLEEVAQKARECDRAWLNEHRNDSVSWLYGVDLDRFKQFCPDGRWTDQNKGLNIVCKKDQDPQDQPVGQKEAPKDIPVNVRNMPRPKINEAKAEVITPQLMDKARLDALREKTIQSWKIAVHSFLAANKWSQCKPDFYEHIGKMLHTTQLGYEAGLYAQAQETIASATNSIKWLINSCDKTRQPAENPKTCQAIDGALEIVEVLKPVGYCKVNQIGTNDFLPVLRSTQPKPIICKVCGSRENGALDNCTEWSFGPGKNVGGWASPFVWCDLDQGVYWCFDEKTFDPSCFDHLRTK